MKIYNVLRIFAGRPEKWFGLDGSSVSKELVPILVSSKNTHELKRIR
ncbi:MAG: hypothetical protein O3B82_03300 [Bacteroidetes bacterium]|nr:hypothetical protein [Bacteroidota bacterium]